MTGIISLPTEILFEVFGYLGPGSLDDLLDDGDLTRLSPSPWSSPSSSTSPSPSPSQSAESSIATETDSQDTDQWDVYGSYKTLHALTRTCRMFYPIAKQLLYEHYRSDLEAPINEYIRSMTIEPALSSYIKHISISFGVADFTGDMRPETEIRKDLQALGATKEHHLYFEDLAQLELAIIVLHAHNLESLQMQAQVHDRELDIDDFPIWLRPFIDAVHHGPKLPLENPRYENLHTLDINMQSTFEPDLSYLFLLPKLRKLRLGSVQFESDSMSENTPPVPWPIATAVSGMQELRLTDVDLPA